MEQQLAGFGCCGVEERHRRHHPHVEHTAPVHIPEPDTLALLFTTTATLAWLKRPRVSAVPTLRPLLDELDREYAARAERRNLPADIAVIDMRLADDGRRLAEEMGDE